MARLTLNHPERLNALNQQMSLGLNRVIEDVGDD